MIQFLAAVGWTIILFFSILGYGWLLSLCASDQKRNVGTSGALGISFLFALGGVLNVLQLVKPFILLIVIAFGVLLFFLYLWKIKSCCSRQKIKNTFLQKSLYANIALIALFVFILIRLCFSLSFFNFNAIDDNGGYLVFPHKLLQTGSLGEDPFSERRLVSSLGGQYFLDALVLVVLDYKYLHIIDNVISYVFLLFAIFASLRFSNFSFPARFGVLVLLALIPSPTTTITSVVTPVLLLYALLSFVLFQDWSKKSELFFIVPLLFSGLFVSKSTMVVPTFFLLLTFLYLLTQLDFKNINKNLSERIWLISRKVTLFASVVALLVLPWAISLYHSSGTLFYPLLGKGYHGSQYGTFASHYFSFDFYAYIRLFFELHNFLILLLPLGVLFCVSYFFVESKKMLALILSAFIGVAALIYATGGYSLYYYSFSFVLPVILFSLIHLNTDRILVKKKLEVYMLSVFVIAFMIGSYVYKSTETVKDIKSVIVTGPEMKVGLFNSQPTSKIEAVSYKRLQESVPEKEIIFARLDKNFLFDFQRNKIFIADTPGAASLSPGMPVFAESEALSDYFLSQNIKYVACSCGPKALFTKESFEGMTKPHVNPWLKTQVLNLFAFQGNFSDLKQTRKIVYEDEVNIVLDLTQKIK